MDKPKIAVVIPWRPQPRRLQPFEYVLDWYATNLPDAEIIVVDSDTENWNGSRARNLGMKKAEEYGADIVIMNDADTVPGILPLLQAIDACEDGRMHNPYTEYHSIPYGDSLNFFNGLGSRELRLWATVIYPFACWGVVVFKPEVWWQLGGMDERISGWGFEDTAMLYAHAILFGTEFIKHDGLMFSFDHEPMGDGTLRAISKNIDYFKEEYLTRKSPDAILEYVKGNILNPL